PTTPSKGPGNGLLQHEYRRCSVLQENGGFLRHQRQLPPADHGRYRRQFPGVDDGRYRVLQWLLRYAKYAEQAHSPADQFHLPGYQTSQVENPNPQSAGANTNWYTEDGYRGGSYVNCSDPTQPGVTPITDVLKKLNVKANCAANT